MSTIKLPEVTIYTDGACNPNPGPGGWAVILLRPKQKPIELSGGEPEATSNRMELFAAISALRALSEPHLATIYTDSSYLHKGITNWLPSWERRGWKTAGKTEVKNQDLWQALAAELKHHQVRWKWTKGHAGHRWNERADYLATSAIPKVPLPLDDENAIHIFTAASYLGNVKKGGWGVVMRFCENVKTLTGSAGDTSGNRLHIQSAVEGLKAIKKPMPIHLYTTSDYLKDGATIWLDKWAARGWQTKEKNPVSHRDLWEDLARLLKAYQVKWHVIDQSEMPGEMAQAKQIASEAAHAG